MKRTTLSVLLLIGVLLIICVVYVLASNKISSYSRRLRFTEINLAFGRECIHLFADQTGKFPESLHELNEYGKKFRNKIDWRFPLRESISSYNPSNFSEHNVLDGTGGLYYNPETGEIKVNLIKPLKSYWRLYFGEERDEVPADW